MKTTVVGIRRKEYDVYIGRAGNTHDGYFGNPFIIGRHGDRAKVIELYREHFLDRLKIDEEFAKRIEGLKGKRLGCFCKPDACHGDVIVEYLEKNEDDKRNC